MAGPFFEPASYIAEEAVSPAEWSRQRAATLQGIGEAARDASKMRQQQQQFQSEQDRLRANEEQRQFEANREYGLDTARFGLNVAAQDLDEARFIFDQERERSRLEMERIKRRDEGVATVVKAMMEGETVEEYNAVAEIAAKQYGINLVPGGGAGTAAGGADGAVPPRSDVAPVAFDEQADQVRNKREAKAVEALPAGGGTTPAGRAVSQQITQGATQAAEARGLPTTLGVQPEVPDVQSAMEGLAKMGPVTRLDEEDRQLTDAAVKQSLLARSAKLKSMGLSPEQLAVAEFLNARAHGIPAPEPQLTQPAQDPNAPPVPMEVTLAPEIEALASAPPDLPRSVVTEGREAGGFTMVDAKTGEVLGTLDWNGIQEARREKRRKKVEPLIRMAQNERDRGMFQAAADAYIEGGDEDAFKTLMSYEAMLYSQSAAYATQDRLIGGEAKNAYKDAYNAAEKQRNDLMNLEGVKAMVQTRNTIDRSLRDLLDPTANPVEQGAALANALSDAATRRATDKDFERFVRTGLYQQLVDFKNYLVSGGAVNDDTIANIRNMLEGSRVWGAEHEKELATQLYWRVKNDPLVQVGTTDGGESMARQRVQELFPSAKLSEIIHSPEPMIGHRQEVRRRRAGRVTGPDAENRVKNLNPSDF